MEISKAKPASLLACVWVRLSDLNRPPRSLWFPPSSHWDDGQQIPAADQKSYRAEVQKAHEKFSETVRLTMLSLLSVGLFCLVALFSVSDSEFLVGNPKVKLPFVDTEISFQNFLVIGPLLLLVVTLYLHIFYGYWLDLESDCQHLSRKGEPLIERLPTLFSLDHPVPQVLSTFIFYWLAPLVLGTITWRAAVPYTWGRFPLALTTGIVSTILLFLQIQRCSAAQRQWNRPRWAVMIVIAACTAIIGFSPEWLEREWFQRSLNIAGADLEGKQLGQMNLRGLDARNANLAKVDLRKADLRGADLRGANLTRANLVEADLRGANLIVANMTGADLTEANLTGAILWFANMTDNNLTGANLEKAHPSGADFTGAIITDAILKNINLREVKGLTKAQIQSADTDASTKLPGDLN